jgi:acetyltransferase-like isoleucine patch superfamily enzyme
LNKVHILVRRFLVPQVAVTAYYFLKFSSFVSTKAEVEMSPLLMFGKGCTVGSFTKIKATEGPLRIGARSGIATGCFLAAHEGGIEIGENFICGPNVSIVASNYVFDRPDVHLEDQGHTSKGIRIGRNVWVGAGTTVLDGAVIGDNTIVVANSLVNRRFPPNSIVQGNPAKVILRRNFEGPEKQGD